MVKWKVQNSQNNKREVGYAHKSLNSNKVPVLSNVIIVHNDIINIRYIDRINPHNVFALNIYH